MYEGDLVISGKEINFTSEYPNLTNEMSRLSGKEILDEWPMYKTESVTIHGLHCKVGCAVVLQYEQDLPIFGLIKYIIVNDKDKYFIIQNTLGPAFFDHHILHYVLGETNQLLIKSDHSLEFKWPLSVYSHENKFV